MSRHNFSVFWSRGKMGLHDSFQPKTYSQLHHTVQSKQKYKATKTAKFHTYGRLLHHTQYARSRWCVVQFTPLHCNNFDFTIHLMIVGLLSAALFQYLKCQDQRVSKNGRSTFIFCSSWNVWGGQFFTFSLTKGAECTPAPRQLRHCPIDDLHHKTLQYKN